jgi:hypothetical protein
MPDLEKTYATQLANIQKRTGKTLAQLTAIVKKSGLEKHGELRDMLKRDLGMGHGDANLVVHIVRGSAGAPAAPAGADPVQAAVDGYYSGPKAGLRPIHDAVMAAVATFGEFEIAPKKTYLSLRRKKQFVMVGPATNTRVEVGLNMQGPAGTSRLEKQAPGKMCHYIVKLTSASDVDRELVGWMKTAFDQAG